MKAITTENSIQFETVVVHPLKMQCTAIISSQTNTCLVINNKNKQIKQLCIPKLVELHYNEGVK